VIQAEGMGHGAWSDLGFRIANFEMRNFCQPASVFCRLTSELRSLRILVPSRNMRLVSIDGRISAGTYPSQSWVDIRGTLMDDSCLKVKEGEDYKR
jgi:hypothetical protein